MVLMQFLSALIHILYMTVSHMHTHTLSLQDYAHTHIHTVAFAGVYIRTHTPLHQACQTNEANLINHRKQQNSRGQQNHKQTNKQNKNNPPQHTKIVRNKRPSTTLYNYYTPTTSVNILSIIIHVYIYLLDSIYG